MTVVASQTESRVFQAGDIIAGRYELRALVGEGGMGAVWKASHVQLTSDVAVKLMSPAIAAQPEALQRFLREARAAAKLSSLHVVKVFDYGVDGQTPFIAMELLEGESLRERLDREGALSPATTAWVLRHAGRALSKAHGEGIVHRDLKPENLFIAKQEEEILKVLDFGVAKLAGTASGMPTTSTRTGALLGTPFYMSPEQARGIRAVDHRTDVWALGVIAFECLTGKLPFDSEAFGDLVLKICTLPAPVPSAVAKVPDGFDAWFARVVEREPERRFQSVDEMLEALQPVLASAPAAAGAEAPAPSVGGSAKGAAAQLGGTRTDVTASQSVMASIPKRGRAPRLWVAALALLALGGWLAFSWLGETPSASRSRPGPKPAALAPAASSDFGRPAAAADEPAAPSGELQPSGEPLAEPESARAVIEPPVASAGEPGSAPVDDSASASAAPQPEPEPETPKVAPIAASAVPVRTVAPAAAAKPPAAPVSARRPAALAAPEPPVAKPPRKDLFSDPD